MAMKIVALLVVLAVTAAAALPTWTPVRKTYIGRVHLTHPSNIYLAFRIPSVIPSGVRAVLIYTTLECGRANQDVTQDVQIFTEGTYGYPHYLKYIYVHSYNQNAWNTNSENMWFPMPANRKVYMKYTRNSGARCYVTLYATGYY